MQNGKLFQYKIYLSRSSIGGISHVPNTREDSGQCALPILLESKKNQMHRSKKDTVNKSENQLDLSFVRSRESIPIFFPLKRLLERETQAARRQAKA